MLLTALMRSLMRSTGDRTARSRGLVRRLFRSRATLFRSLLPRAGAIRWARAAAAAAVAPASTRSRKVAIGGSVPAPAAARQLLLPTHSTMAGARGNAISSFVEKNACAPSMLDHYHLDVFALGYSMPTAVDDLWHGERVGPTSTLATRTIATAAFNRSVACLLACPLLRPGAPTSRSFFNTRS